MPQKTADAISASYELCSRSTEVRVEIEYVIAEARQTIAASKALIDRLNRLDDTNRESSGIYYSD